MTDDREGLLLAVDPGLDTTGWAVMALTGEPLAFGRWRVRGATPEEIGRGLADELLVEIARHRPTVLAVEMQFVDFRAKGRAREGRAEAMLKLAALRGALCLAATWHGLRIVTVNPQQAKAALAFAGCDKAAMVAHANARWGLSLTDGEADVADALGIGLAAVRLLAPDTQAVMTL